MKTSLHLVLLFVAFPLAYCQQPASSPTPELPKNPQAIIEAAKAHYDFADPSLKPWHLKANYQLNDEEGKATEQGSWEYWRASAKLYRSTVIRAGASQTIWAAPDGTVYRKVDGQPLKYFERNLDTILLHELPQKRLLEKDRSQLGIKIIGKGPSSIACVTATLLPEAPIAVPEYYCFDPATLALLEAYTNPLEYKYADFAKMGDHYLPRKIEIRIGKQVVLTMSVESIDLISNDSPYFNPDAGAPAVARASTDPYEEIAPNERGKLLVKKSFPVYPPEAKSRRLQGVVVLGATIGVDGKISDVEVLGSPSPILSRSAVECVRTWEYKPFIVDGKAVEVETTINVIFTMTG